MNFDIEDVKSWANRHDVNTLSDAGFFGNSLLEIDNEIRRYNKGEKDRLHMLYQISDNGCCCFGYATYFSDTGAFKGTNNFAFFLPLDAVKKDKPKKKYRPFKSMAEFTKVVYNLVPDYLNITGVGESFMVRRKYNQHFEKVLITHLEYDENHNLISINGQSLKSLFENYEIITDDDKIIPFGVEVTS